MNYYQDSGELIVRLYNKDDYAIKYQVCKNTVITEVISRIEKRVTTLSSGRTRTHVLAHAVSDRLNYNCEAMFISERADKSGPIRTKSGYDLKGKIEVLSDMIKEAGGIVLGKDDKYFNRLDPKKKVAEKAKKKIQVEKLSKGDFLKEINTFT